MTSRRISRALPGIAAVALLLSAAQVVHDRDPVARPEPEVLRLVEVARGIPLPTDLASPPGDERLFVTSWQGTIHVVEHGVRQPTPFLDLSGFLSPATGLMSVTFHPDYARNGRFFVVYLDQNVETWLVEYTVSADPGVADPTSARTLIGPYPQVDTGHNWNCVRFGPDGMLYVATGDGGASHTNVNGQDLTSLNGKVLRLDVDLPAPFIPADNPLVGVPGVREEIWVVGLRNPWRLGFDSLTSDLYIADVGNNDWEEVNYVPGGGKGVANFGWRCKEGPDCTTFDCCDSPDFIAPIHVFDHSDGKCAVIGGELYRGAALPWLQGAYLFADFCSSRVWSLRYDGVQVTEMREHTLELGPSGTPLAYPITSISCDSSGEIYMLDRDGGQVFKVVPRSTDRYCVAQQHSGGGAMHIDTDSSISVSANQFQVVASDGIPNSFGLFFYGQNRVRLPFGDGFRCVGGDIYRLQPPVQVGRGGSAIKNYDLTRPPRPGGLVEPGATWHFQFWYRDSGAGGAGFNLSDGVSVTFMP